MTSKKPPTNSRPPPDHLKAPLKTILCIEGRHDDLTTMASMLQASATKWRAITAQSVDESIAKAREEHPHTILLDLENPDIDGFQLYRRLRADTTTQHIPIIMVSAIMTDDSHRTRGLKTGADGFLAKPVNRAVLLAQVNMALRLKAAEDELRRQKAELESRMERNFMASEDRFRNFFKTSKDAVFITSRDGRWLEINDALVEMLGYDSQEELKQLHAQEAYWNKEDRNHYLNQVEREGFVRQKEMDMRKKDGGILHTLFTTVSIKDDHGKTVAYQGTIRDQTAEKVAEQEQAALREQLQHAQKMEAIGTLAGGIAHDFNNILTSILGFTELSLGALEKGSTLHDNLLEVHIAGNRAKNLVRQILTISRHDKSEIQPVEIAPLIKEALKMLRSTLPTSIELKQDIAAAPLVVEADATQLHQVFVNLITNAAQAISDANGTIETVLREIFLDRHTRQDFFDVPPGRYVLLSVSDSGEGIPPHHIDNIFEPYFTTKEKGDGTGLGLTVVHGIVTSCKGHIRVNSILKQGTTFHVFLPQAHADTKKAPPQHGDRPLPRGTERILVVDDEKAVAKMQQRMLENLGYHVTVRTSSAETLALFKQTPDDFDLLITDMTMPKMTGAKLALAVKEIRGDFPVILCTGHNTTVDEHRKIAIDGLLLKPLTREQMAKLIRNVLAKRNHVHWNTKF